MSNFKGTKGPWYPVEYAGRFVLQTEDRYSDSDDIFESDDFSYEEAKANAQVASNATALLEFAEKVANFHPDGNPAGLIMEAIVLVKNATK